MPTVVRLTPRPALLLLASVTLALGVAASTSVFSLGNFLLYGSIPGISTDDRLVAIEFRRSGGGTVGVSQPLLDDLRTSAAAVTNLTGLRRVEVDVMVAGRAPFSGRLEIVEHGYFELLGLSGFIGTIPPGADWEGPATSPVVISESFWTRALGADPAAVGTTLRLNGAPFIIAGIIGSGFRGTDRLVPHDLWVGPGSFATLEAADPPGVLSDPSADLYRLVLGALTPGAERSEAAAQMSATWTSLAARHPAQQARMERYPPLLQQFSGLSLTRHETIADLMRLLQMVALTLVVISVANASNVLLLRSVSLRPQRMLKVALGATPRHLLREQFQAFAVVVAGTTLLAALISPLLSRLVWGVGTAVASFGGDVPGTTGSAVLFTLGASVSAMALAAVVARIGDQRFGEQVPYATGSRSQGERRGAHIRTAMVVVQLALTLTLLVPSILLTATLATLKRVDIGLDPHGVLEFSLAPDRQGISQQAAETLYRRLEAELRGDPTIQEVAQASTAAFGPPSLVLRLSSPSRLHSSRLVSSRFVGPGYFDALGIRTLAGSVRILNDAGTERSVVVTRSLAHFLFPDSDAIGQAVQTDSTQGGHQLRIVAVVNDVRLDGLRTSEPYAAFLPLTEYFGTDRSFIVKSYSADLDRSVRRTTEAHAAGLPVLGPKPIDEDIDALLSEESTLTQLVGALTLMGIALSALSLYAVSLFTVQGKIRELGIRSALGETAAGAIGRTLNRSVLLWIIGMVAGTPGAVLLARTLRARLYGVDTGALATYALAAGCLLGLVVLSTIPALLRVAKVSPVETMQASS